MGIDWTGPWVRLWAADRRDPLSSLFHVLGPFIEGHISFVITEERPMGHAEVISLGNTYSEKNEVTFYGKSNSLATKCLAG